MMDYRDAKAYWIAARNKRGLSIAALARAMSAHVGYEVKRDQLSNFEYKGTKPSIDLWNAIERQIRLWRQEDVAGGEILRKMRASYEADYVYAACSVCVPGPTSGAHYCLNCGSYYSFKICVACQFVEQRLDADFCVRCGKKFEEV